MAIHPQFNAVTDPYIAEVLSEPLSHAAGTYKFAMQLEGGNPKSLSPAYPPEPAYLSMVTAAYLDQDGESIRRVCLRGISGDTYAIPDTEAIRRYESHVVQPVKVLAPIINALPEYFGLEPTKHAYGALGKWCVEAAQRDGTRLLAAHWINVTPNRNRVMDAIAYPGSIKDTFPLLMRMAIEPLALADASGELQNIGVQLHSQLKTTMRAYLRGDAMASNYSAVGPASMLPSLEIFKQLLRSKQV